MRELTKLVGVILVAGVVAVAYQSSQAATPGTGTPAAAPGTTAPDAPVKPIYMGVPQANVTARWGTEPSPGDGYLRCAGQGILSAWHVSYDTATDRANYIGSRQGCFPDLQVDWRAMARPYLPPDARLVEEVADGSNGPVQHYSSGWLRQRIGDGEITVHGTNGTVDAPGPDITIISGWTPPMN